MDCRDLIHPFQNDPGVSQSQRIMSELLSGPAKIDGRKLTDLLDYFMKLSGHINFYETDGTVKQWGPFFENSPPFIISAIAKFNKKNIEETIEAYEEQFKRRPSKAGLRLLIGYISSRILEKINTWQQKLSADSSLPLNLSIDKLIKDKLSAQLTEFIALTNTAVKWYGIKPVSFNSFLKNEVWDLDTSHLYGVIDTQEFISWGSTKRKRMIELRGKIAALLPTFLNGIDVMSITAGQSIEQSMFPLIDEMKEKHPPHLAVIFSFLKLFSYLQDDLNSYTRRHLDFFYKNVLKLVPKDSGPDKAHIVFEIQKQLNKYLLKEGLLLKDGKDNNKVDILFSTDSEIVVNKAQVADKKTLFLNNISVSDTVFVEGVYMASDASKADGVDKDFEDETAASWPTLGAHLSKYTDPENKFLKPYPNARIGFILASPVLLLNEGTRTITITLSCNIKNICESLLPIITTGDPCCEGSSVTTAAAGSGYPEVFDPKNLYAMVRAALTQKWYYINRELIVQAVKLGISKELLEKLNGFLIKSPAEKLCYCPVEEKLYERTLTAAEFNLTGDERELLKDIFKERYALNVAFSGEKEWIIPEVLPRIVLSPTLSGSAFTITIESVIAPDEKAVTFYNAENLKEDFGTTLPLVKIELDDKIKLIQNIPAGTAKTECCQREIEETTQPVSLYHFFRDVIVKNTGTKIDVKVCGLKNFIVQNDESLQDVNAPIYPFGTRPNVIGFDLVNPVVLQPGEKKNLVGSNFYIGSKEVFCKKWNDVYININWKDKPNSFNEYYKAYWVDKNDQTKFGLNENDFQVNISLLENGEWKKEKNYTVPNPPPPNNVTQNTETLDFNRPLFRKDVNASSCIPPNPIEQSIHISKEYINNISQEFQIDQDEFKVYKKDTLNGFLKLNLQNQDFLHKDYSFVLARQMMALGKFPKEFLEGATYLSAGNTLIVFEGIAPKLVLLDGLVDDTVNKANASNANANTIQNRAITARDPGSDEGKKITDNEFLSNPNLNTPIQNAVQNTGDTVNKANDVRNTLNFIKTQLSFFDIFTGKLVKELAVLIPNEPWTPIIKEMSIDYTASAPIDDINLIHLYPYTGTYKNEELQSEPALLPTYCDEGSLFLGLADFIPGSSLNILFQLAEATADSESERDFAKWYYLENNIWKLLRKGFEVIDDATDGLTTSGIVKFALPANMTNENTVLPKGMHWIKAAIPTNSKSVSETIGIHTQAVRAVFTNDAENDKKRLSSPLPAGSISKLLVADASVKKTVQPYDSFGGSVPEGDGHFYVRVSELLKHKGRAILKFDYERLALEAFPQLFKVKCINHSFALNAHKYYNDFPVAPGYVLLAVIPDLNKLKAAKQFEPRVPVSLLEDIQDHFRQRTSPFVRLWVKNPRYEKVNFCLKVKLYLGKDESYYKEKLQQDLREFLAPWAVGKYDKLAFGQCIVRSDIVSFIESRDYVDYILDLKMQHEDDTTAPADQPKICPVTPRSILIAGVIDICIKQQECESWCKEGVPCENEPEEVVNYCEEENIG